MAPLSSINKVIGLVNQLWDLAKTIEQAEIRQLIASITNELADTKLEMAELKSQVVTLERQKQDLELALQRRDGPRPKVQGEFYVFDSDSEYYCTACYDSKGLKVRVTRESGSRFMCPVCKAEYRSRRS